MNLTVFILLISLFQTAEKDTLLLHQSASYLLIKPAKSGDGQSRMAKHELPEPVRVYVLDSSGLPVAGAEVCFNILSQQLVVLGRTAHPVHHRSREQARALLPCDP